MDEDGRGYHLPLQWPYLNKEPGRLGYGVVVGWRSGLLTGSQPANISMIMIGRKGPTASKGISVGGRACQHVVVLTRRLKHCSRAEQSPVAMIGGNRDGRASHPKIPANPGTIGDQWERKSALMMPRRRDPRATPKNGEIARNGLVIRHERLRCIKETWADICEIFVSV